MARAEGGGGLGSIPGLPTAPPLVTYIPPGATVGNQWAPGAEAVYGGSHPAVEAPYTTEWEDYLIDPGDPGQTWADLINADSGLQAELAAITGEETGDVATTKGDLRNALIRMGATGIEGGLQGLLAKANLGADWADLLDAGTLAGAQGADTSGTSTSAQLAKYHAEKKLAEADLRAARGQTQSGQTGFEITAENQRNVNAVNDAITQLLGQLSGGIRQYGERKGQRQQRRLEAPGRAVQRLRDMGVEPRAARAPKYGRRPKGHTGWQ